MARDPLAIADRMRLLDASGIRKVFDLAAKMTDPINLSIGQPDFDVPDVAKEVAIEAIRAGDNKYTQTQGKASLIQAVAKLCQREFGWSEAEKRSYLITSGVSGGLLLAIETTVNPGDEVIFTDPYFVMYSHLVNFCGGVPVRVSTYPDFKPDVNKIADAITDKTRMLMINSPSNPTGVVYSEQDLRDIADLARKHDLLVLSDEIYDMFCYDQPFTSIAKYYEKTLLLRGFSKSYAMTGWRIGWATGPAKIIDKMTMLQQYTFVCAPSIAQAAALAALDVDMTPHIQAYKKKRDMVYDALGETFGMIKPGGAFYAFVPAPGGDATKFVTKAIENNVLVIPGNVFSAQDTHFRLCYTTTDDILQRGLEILNKIAK